MSATWGAVPVLLLAALLTATEAPAASRRSRRPKPPALPGLIVPAAASARELALGEACRRALGSASGGVVAMDPRTGRVVAIVNPGQSLVRAYQPCSVFKVVVAVAGLSEGVITSETRYPCRKGCWIWPGHGWIDLRRALAVSCNPYFEWVGEQLGYGRVQRYARLLGLGSPSGINLTGETAGQVPGSLRPELVGRLASHAEGVASSAVQLAVLISATVNGGIVFQPQVAPAAGFVPRERWRLPDPRILSGLADGFLAAVDEGSASNAFDPDVVVAGKTGSCSRMGWFASYAPADRPELVVVVFVRRGNGHQASAIAGRIYQALFKPSPPPFTAGGGPY
jgi:cell division protein FtsI/penicillin-binding protein 2